MVGTVVDYSKITDYISWIKVLSGEKVYTIHLIRFDNNIRMGAEIEFIPNENNYTIIK